MCFRAWCTVAGSALVSGTTQQLLAPLAAAVSPLLLATAYVAGLALVLAGLRRRPKRRRRKGVVAWSKP